MITVALNQQFEIADSKEVATISGIQYVKIVDGKKIKLKDPVCTVSYKSDRKDITTYMSEVKRLLEFNRWKKLN